MGKQNAHLREQKEEIAFIFLILIKYELRSHICLLNFLRSPGAELLWFPTLCYFHVHTVITHIKQTPYDVDSGEIRRQQFAHVRVFKKLRSNSVNTTGESKPDFHWSPMNFINLLMAGFYINTHNRLAERWLLVAWLTDLSASLNFKCPLPF